MTEHRVKEIFVSDKSPLGKYFERQTYRAGRLGNSSIFLQRNTMTGLKKLPHVRSDNENEVIDRLVSAWPEFKRTRTKTLIAATIGKDPTDKERQKKVAELRALHHQNRMATSKEWLLDYNKMEFVFKFENDENYRKLHSHVAQNIIRDVADSFSNFFDGLAAWKENPAKFSGRPNMPGYSASDSHKTITYSRGDCRVVKSEDGSRETLVFPQGRGEEKDYKPTLDLGSDFMEAGVRVGEVTVKPVGNGFKINIGYDVDTVEYIEDNGRYAGIDLGLENLITMTSNVEGLRPLIVDGREVKSSNQYFNKELARIQSELPADVVSSRAMYRLLAKRHGQLKTMLNSAAHLVADYAHANNLCKVIIGKNNGWKLDFKALCQVKQSFMFVPYNDLIDAIIRACNAYGIEVICREESYTSQASLFDMDSIPTWDGKHRTEYKFSGKRITRGLYEASDGRLVNADVNAAGNTLRKWKASAFDKVENFNYLMNPIKVRISRGGARHWHGSEPKCLADTVRQ